MAKYNVTDKNYIRPTAEAERLDVFCQDGVETYGDLIFALQNGTVFCTFVLSKDRANYIPEPTHRYFAIGNSRIFERGSGILIDTLDGKSALRRVKRVDGNVIWLDEPLNHLPKLGGDVMKVLGVTGTMVDVRATEKVNRG